MPAATEHLDVLIVGAGLSGVGAACQLKTTLPGKTFAIFEGRETMGGTWDLFRYPGIRSDSDMFTLGYSFAPWKSPKSIADGPSILAYIKETAHDFGVDEKIRYHHRVLRAEWSSDDAQWTIEALRSDTGETVLSNFGLRDDAEYFYSECKEVVSVPEKHVNEKGQGNLTFQSYFHTFPDSVSSFFDDAIVVVENIVLHRDAGQPRGRKRH